MPAVVALAIALVACQEGTVYKNLHPGPMIYPAQFAPMPAPNVSPTTGMRRELPRRVVGGNTEFDIDTPIALLDARAVEWGTWAITLDPMYSVSSPWPANAANAPNNGLNAGGSPRAIINFGSGGATRTVEVDYPVSGVTFLVNTDNIGISARATITDPVATATATPVLLAAWAVPAAAQAVSTPLILTLPDSQNVAVVPPFARYLVLSPHGAGGALAAGVMTARFTDWQAGGGLTWDFSQAYPAGGSGPIRFPVPPQAVRVDIGSTVGPAWTVFWEISLT